MNCKDAVGALIASLEVGTPMSDEARAHVSGCERCSSLLASAREFQASLHDGYAAEPSLDPATTTRAEHEVVRTRRERILIRVFAVFLLTLLFSVLAFVAVEAVATPGERFAVFFGGILIATIVAVPVLGVLALVRSITRPRNGRPLYKRLGPGRMVDGVAMGIAESMGVNVSMVRLVFLALVFFHGAGLIIYALLGSFMPVHPDDRQYMLRFRLRRWLRRNTNAADNAR